MSYDEERGRQLDIASLDILALESWEGTAWRMHASKYFADDPGGAYKYSGRYHRGEDLFGKNEVFPALYLATAPEVTVGEKQRHLTSTSLPQMRNQVLSKLRISLQAVCDLRVPEEAGISRKALIDDHDYSFPQSISVALRDRGAEALLVPSATLLGDNLVVFPDLLLKGSSLEVAATQETRLYVDKKADESS